MSSLREDIKRYSLLPYSLHVVPGICTDGSVTFVASNPELPGCMSHGDTVEQAVQHLAEARELYIADLVERRLPVPMPASASTATVFSFESIIWEQLTVQNAALPSGGTVQTNIPEEVSVFKDLVP